MTAPNITTLDDVEQSLAAAAVTPKVTESKLEGDEIPQELRGKTVAELLQHADALKRSLILSEQARTSMAQMPAPQPPPAPVVEEPKEMTDEELAELHQTDPVKAIRVMQEQSNRMAMKNLEARLNPLLAGTSSAVENGARAKYPDEFAALGQEITAFAAAMPNKSILSDPVAWDQLITYVRGQHFGKMMDYVANKGRTAAADSARNAQVDATGAVFAPTQSSVVTRQPVVMDDYTKEIARNLSMTPEEYQQWSKV